MSFSIEFTGRSPNHALQLLDSQKRHLPAPVFDFIAIAINNIEPKVGHQTVVHVKAHGHLCQGAEWSPVSLGEIKVTPTLIPD